MPRGLKGERRPADVIGNAVHVMKLATGKSPKRRPRNVRYPAWGAALTDRPWGIGDAVKCSRIGK